MSDKNKFYDSYSHMDSLRHGDELRLQHSLSFRADRADLTPFVSAGLEQLAKLRDASVAAEESMFDELKISMLQWEHQGALTMILNRALEYLRTPSKSHTSNEWKRGDGYDKCEEISNRVYKMWVSIYESTEYNRHTGQSEPVAWYVSWNVRTNNPGVHSSHIAGQDRKKFTDKSAAMKYIEGRKKAYSHLFTEISPPIPQQYASQFEVNGLLLPGYTVEGCEPVVAQQTAAEVIESLVGGDFMSEDKKPSVLGKLAANMPQTKSQAAPSVTKKKKEDIQI